MKQFLIISLLFLCKSAICSIIEVPTGQTSIQAGIDAAKAGDTVLVAPGIYVENITIAKDSFTLASWFLTTGDRNYIAETKIDGSDLAVITILPPSTEAVSIIGFTIQNGEDGILAYSKFSLCENRVIRNRDGLDYKSGGGICKNNIFEYNTDDGVDLDSIVDILIEDNIMANNGDDGIEIRLHEYRGNTLNIKIRGNQIYGNAEDGIQFVDYPDTSNRIFWVERNIIFNNDMAGIGCMGNGNTFEDYRGEAIPETIYLFNNTIDNNNYGLTGGHNLVAVNNLILNSKNSGIKNVTGNSIVSYSLFHGNGLDTENSNLNMPTLVFEEPGLDADYALLEGSPCIDRGAPVFVWQSDTVLKIAPDGYFGNNPDIGAIESQFITAGFFSEIKSGFKIYPNPNKGCFCLDLNAIDKDLVYEIVNLRGEIVKKSKIKGAKIRIDLSAYPKGLYFLKLHGDKTNFTSKIFYN